MTRSKSVRIKFIVVYEVCTRATIHVGIEGASSNYPRCVISCLLRRRVAPPRTIAGFDLLNETGSANFIEKEHYSARSKYFAKRVAPRRNHRLECKQPRSKSNVYDLFLFWLAHRSSWLAIIWLTFSFRFNIETGSEELATFMRREQFWLFFGEHDHEWEVYPLQFALVCFCFGMFRVHSTDLQVSCWK